MVVWYLRPDLRRGVPAGGLWVLLSSFGRISLSSFVGAHAPTRTAVILTRKSTALVLHDRLHRDLVYGLCLASLNSIILIIVNDTLLKDSANGFMSFCAIEPLFGTSSLTRTDFRQYNNCTTYTSLIHSYITACGSHRLWLSVRTIYYIVYHIVHAIIWNNGEGPHIDKSTFLNWRCNNTVLQALKAPIILLSISPLYYIVCVP